MKVKSMMAALLLIAAGVQTMWAQKMVVTMADDNKVVYDIVQVKDITFEEAEEHDWVDLGLPSGTLWATCNVGANSPEEYGDYFAWGETEPKDEYGWGTYKWCNGTWDSLTKYNQDSGFGYKGFIDTLTELLPEDDAAIVNWGSDWQMPSRDQFKELIDSRYTTTEWTMQNGVNGRKIRGKNGYSIFLPASDVLGATNKKYGFYWSSSLSSSCHACVLQFHADVDHCVVNGIYRCEPVCIRPVRVKN